MNVLGLLWGGLMLINFLWFSTQDKTFGLRWLTNPKPVQTDYFGTGPLVHFFGFLNHTPVEMLMVLIVAIGAICYLAAQRSKPFTPIAVPDDSVPTVGAAGASG